MKKTETIELKDHPFDCPCYSIKEHYMKTDEDDNFMHKIVHYPSTVSVLPITKEGKIVLVKEYRAAVEDYMLACPAGRLDDNEFTREAAIRELEEETGLFCSTKNLHKLGTFYTAPGYSTERNTMFIAKDCRYLYENERTHFPDENEYIEVCEFSLGEVTKLVDDGKIKGMKTVMLLNWYISTIVKKQIESLAENLNNI